MKSFKGVFRQYSRRKNVVLQIIKYRGLKLKLMDNRSKRFKFEYEIEVPNSKLRLTKSNHSFHKVIFDPTSHKNRSYAIDYGKMHINELLSPFWYLK